MSNDGCFSMGLIICLVRLHDQQGIFNRLAAHKLIRGVLVYKMSFCGIAKWPLIGGWLLIRVDARSRFYCISNFLIYFDLSFDYFQIQY